MEPIKSSRTYFYNKRTQNIYKLIGSKGNVIYLQCDVDNCGNHAKWRKNANIVEEYEADHNHNCSVSYNKFKVHCMMFRIKEIVDDTENVRKTASEVFNMAVDEFSSSPISLPNGFKKKMIKKIYNARNRRCVHRTSNTGNVLSIVDGILADKHAPSKSCQKKVKFSIEKKKIPGETGSDCHPNQKENDKMVKRGSDAQNRISVTQTKPKNKRRPPGIPLAELFDAKSNTGNVLSIDDGILADKHAPSKSCQKKMTFSMENIKSPRETSNYRAECHPNQKENEITIRKRRSAAPKSFKEPDLRSKIRQ